MSHNPNVKTIYGMSKEPSGFPNRTDSVVAFDDGTRTLSVAPVSDSFEYYVKGVKYKHLSAATSQITDTEGLWHFYFDGYTLQNTQTFTQAIITDHAYVALIYWDAANNQAIYFGEERHGMAMDGATHIYLHNTNGAVYINGLGLGDFSIDGSGGISADGYFSVANGIIYDEDIIHTITDGSPQDLAPISRLPVFFREGTAGDWRRKPIDPFPVVYPGSVSGYDLSNTLLAYNNFNGTTWSLQEVANNNYVLAHVLATNDKVHPVIAILGTNEYNNSNAARTGATTELATLSGLPFAELVPVGTVIFQTSSGYTNAIKGRIVSTDTGEDYVDFRNVAALPIGQINDHGNLSGLSDADHPAAAIYTNTALFNGNLSSADNTVQAALDTLDNISIVGGSGTATQLAYFTGAAALGSETAVGSDALTWDAANNRLGIRTSAPSTALDVSGADAKINGLTIGRGNAGAAATSTALGVSALAASTGANNTAIGYQAADVMSTGFANTAVGASALGGLTTSSQSTAVGFSAGGGALTTPNVVTAVGYQALAVTTASSTAVGANAGLALTTGSLNALLGSGALQTATTASQAVAVGAGAANIVAAATANLNSVAVGYVAQVGTTSTGQNTSIGSQAGSTLSGGVGITTGSNLTLLGYNAQPSAATASNEITLGNSSVTTLRCATNTITLISDARDKADVQDISLGLDFLATIRPVQFRWDRREWYSAPILDDEGNTIGYTEGVSDGTKKQDKFEAGFIAQELDAAQIAANAEWMGLALKSNPDRLEATPLRLFPVVVKACQELAVKAATAEARADAAEARIAALEAAILGLNSQ